jgi:Bacterial SH3 domain
MKIKLFLAALSLAGTATLSGATLSVPTAVQSQPDPASAVIEVLKAGSEQPAPSTAPAPDGWLAVDLPGPFEAYVKNKDLTKQLDVLPGASIRLSPKDGAAVLTVFQKGDKAEITGLHGSWTQIRLDKTLVGYIQSGPIASAPLVPAAPVPSSGGAPVPVPSTQPAAGAAAPAPAAPPGDDIPLSRLFEGTLASTKALLSLHRPYDWQLNDANGKRVAYIDLSKLLLTDQIENYAGRNVVVLGALLPIKDSRDLVIAAEGLRLK